MKTDVTDPAFGELKAQLWAHIQQVARDRDPYIASEGHFYVQHYLQENLARWGAVEVQQFTVRGQTHQNFLLKLPGQDSKLPPVLVSAHYDAVPGTPGADDNATGVAVLLELGRSLSATPARHPVWLVAFDLEEFGLEGSRHCAAQLYAAGQRLRLMLSLEMLGYCSAEANSQRYPADFFRYFYPSEGNFIGLIGNPAIALDLQHLSRSLHRVGKVPAHWFPAVNQGKGLPDLRRSDHAPFWDLGYPAVLITDTANLRNPHYHQSSDRPETLDLDFLTRVCQGLQHGIQSL
ncbi:MAG: M28 family peptidase [Cyanobacteria bacterium J069]|nr:MAG: M28 family peptidase [Cyanobacteria bacterium J069]